MKKLSATVTVAVASMSLVPPIAPADPKTKLSNTDNKTKISEYQRTNIQYSFLDDRPPKSFQRRITVNYAKRHLATAGISVAEEIDVELDAATILDDDDLRELAAAGRLPGNRIEQPQVVHASDHC